MTNTYRHSPKEFLQAASQALKSAEQALGAIVAQLPGNPQELQARRVNAYRDVRAAKAMVEAALERLPRHTLGSAGPVVTKRSDIGTPSQLRANLLSSPHSGKDKFPGVTEPQVSPEPDPNRSWAQETGES